MIVLCCCISKRKGDYDDSSGSWSGSWSDSSGGGRRKRRHVHEHVEVIDHGPWGGQDVIVHREERNHHDRRHSRDSSEESDWNKFKNAHQA